MSLAPVTISVSAVAESSHSIHHHTGRPALREAMVSLKEVTVHICSCSQTPVTLTSVDVRQSCRGICGGTGQAGLGKLWGWQGEFRNM